MSEAGLIRVERWSGASIVSAVVAVALAAVLAAGPLLFAANAVDRLTTLFIYVMLAVTWNALAGYGGLVSIGQQAFFGLGAYAAVRLASFGVGVYPALALAAILVGALALPVSAFMLRLRAGEFAIGMWIVAALAHLLVNLDTLVRGETGTSLIELDAYPAGLRRALTYWAALAAMATLIGALFAVLRSPLGAAIQAIRDNEGAAAAVGVRVMRTKRVIFVLAAFGVALAGALWLATTITFQPKTYFSVQWTAYMVFMVLVGGLGTFEGPILGALIYFAIEALFGATGVWYLVGLGGAALLFALFLPRGLWGFVEARFGLRLLPVGRWLRIEEAVPAGAPAGEEAGSTSH
jgi:branched-chain amino acid transport system permease protein